MNHRALCVLVPLVALALGCSDDGEDGGEIHDDCRDPERSCFAPFVCRASTQNEAYGCFSPEGDIPACSGTPAGQVVPFQEVAPGGPVVHWQLDSGCIPVTYEPAVASFATAIASGAQAWNDVACSDLCLEAAVESSTEPEWLRGERGIHVELGTVPGDRMTTTITFEQPTGRIYVALVTIDEQNQEQIDDHHFLKMFGTAIGLGAAASGASSVMAPENTATALTADDQAAVCQLYGDPSYCGD